MKRRDFIKTGIVTAGSLLFPGKSSGLENKLYGRVIDTLSEEPIENAELWFYEYPNNNFFDRHTTDSNGLYNMIPTGIERLTSSWRDVKLGLGLGDKNALKRLQKGQKAAKKAGNGLTKIKAKHDDYFDAVRYSSEGLSQVYLFNV